MLTAEMKKAIKDIMRVANSVGNAFEDGKISAMEGFGLLASARNLPDTIKTVQDVIKKKTKFSSEERLELTASVKQYFDLKNDNLEAQIERALDLVNRTYSAYEINMNLYEDWRNFITEVRA